MLHFRTLVLPLFAAACLMLSACNRDNAPAADVSKPAPALPNPQDPAALEQLQKTAAAAALPKPNLATPLDAYKPITSGESLMYLFYAVAKLNPDMSELAALISADYRNTADQFKRQDLLKQLEPRIKAKIAEQAGNHYVIWDVEGPVLEHYDFQNKRFPVKSQYWDGNNRFYWNDLAAYHIGFSAPESLHYLTVNDEALARHIEDMISKYQNFQLRLHAFVQDVDLNDKTLKSVVTHLELRDKSGKVLAFQ